MNTQGQHLLIDMWLNPCDIEFVTDEILSYVSNKFTVVKSSKQFFEPQGRTEVFILSESHFTVHTYPEHNYISLDLYICNMGIDMELVKDAILDIGNPTHCKTRIINRG